MRGWGGRRMKRRVVPPDQERICRDFKVPVTHLRFSVQHLDRTTRPWTYRAVLN